MVRIHACHAWGREFESRPDRQTNNKTALDRALFYYLGLLGFDSRDNGFVSMQADAPEALKTDAKQ